MRIRTFLISTTALVSCGMVSCALPALANPLGGQVVGGQATISGQGTAHVTVNQQSQNAIVNWHTFNIGAGERTQFVQPNSTSVILNRVTGGEGPSQIMGTIDANGRVFLVNRDGIIFGAGAQINTAGFLATTSDIRNDDFMAGRYNFSIPGRPDASIVNHGNITASNSGFAALVAPGVRNTGTITAALGTIGLAAGNTFSLDFYGDKLITLGVGDAIASQVKDVSTGQTLKSLVTNTGKLSANGGRVEITAAAARTIVDSVINTSGVIEANSVGVKNGQIVLSAATAGTKGAGAPKQTVKISGTVSAAGKTAGTKGGKIKVTGENIEIANARIDASGRDGGGTVLIGGDWGGGTPDKSLVNNQSAVLDGSAVPTAATVSVDSNSVIDASAKDRGHGGKVILWSDVKTTFTGVILALGGQEFGNGGFVETSSKGQLNFGGNVDTRAPNGQFGTLLLDPADYYIVTTLGGSPTGASEITASALQDQLNNGNVVIATGTNAAGGNGDIFVNAPVTWNYVSGESGSLTLAAYRHIYVNQSITNIEYGGSGNAITLRADSTGTGIGTVTFAAGKEISTEGAASIYYNPTTYASPTDYSLNLTKGGIAYMLVNHAGNLGQIATNPSGDYALGKSFNATSGTGISFNGTFTGNGGLGTNYTITGLTGALFATINLGANIRDLNLAGVNITTTLGGSHGTLANINDGEISNVTVSGTLNAGNTDGATVGGLVGYNSTTGTITGSKANVAVSTGTADIGDPVNNFTRSAHAGGLVGFNFGTISNSSATGAVSGKTNSLIGGLVGTNGDYFTGGGTITGSYATGAVTLTTGVRAFAGMAGGLVGDNWGSISSSYASGNVSITGQFDRAYAGGLVGQLGNGATAGTIATSYASGDVTINVSGGNAGSAAGGLVGESWNGTSITNAYAIGDVEATVTGVSSGATLGVGGFVGQNSSVITNVYSAGKVIASSPNLSPYVSVGGFIGGNSADEGEITGAHWDTATAGQANAFGTGAVVSGVTGLTMGDRYQQVTYNFSGGGFASEWFMVDGETRPFLRAEWSETIVNAHQLQLMAMNLSASYKLGADIQLGHGGGSTMWSSSGFSPVGSNADPYSAFTGSLDGQGYAINNLTIRRESETHVGLFGYTGAGSVLSNIRLVGADVFGEDITGALVGENHGQIDRSSSTGGVHGEFQVGGLVGWNWGTISRSYSTANVSGPSENAAGNYVGGLVGTNYGTVTQSYATGWVDGTDSVGGLIGLNGCVSPPCSTGNVTYSYALGDVNGVSNLGGLIGHNAGTVDQTYSTGYVADTSSSGGLIGNNAGTVTNSYWDVVTSDKSNAAWAGSASLTGMTGLAGGAFQQSSYNQLDFANHWYIANNATRPFLRSEWSETITNTHQLQLMTMYKSVSYKLGSNIDFSNAFTESNMWPGYRDTQNYFVSIGFAPVGDASDRFEGRLDGQGYTISDLTIAPNTALNGNIGLFGVIGTNGHISNLTIENAFVAADSAFGNSGHFIGVVAGQNAGTIDNVTIRDSEVSHNGVASGVAAGGIVGMNGIFGPGGGAGTISNSTVLSTMVTVGDAATGAPSNSAGGIAGVNLGTITGAVVDSRVDTSGFAPVTLPTLINGGRYSYVGGLVGRNELSATISNSSANATVTGTNAAFGEQLVGGFVGYNAFGATITESSSTGVASSTSAVGGFAGGNRGEISNSNSEVNVSVSAGGIAGGFVGENNGIIFSSNAEGNVTGGANSFLGGFAAGNFELITDSNAYGDVTGTGTNVVAGGFAGLNSQTIELSTSWGTVTGTSDSYLGGFVGINIGLIQNSNSYSDVIGSGGNNFAGGLVGMNFGFIDPTYSTGNVTSGANSVVGGFVGANGALSFPDGSIIIGSIAPDGSSGSGTASGGPGSLVGPQVGYQYPISGTPQLPTNSCSQTSGFCGGTLFNPFGQSSDPFQDNINSPLLNIAAGVVNTILPERKDEEIIKASTEGSGQGGSSGSSGGGGQGGGNSGTGGRPPVNTVPPTGLGPLPSGMPPLNETRFASNEIVMQLGLNLTPEQVAQLARQYGLEVISSHTITLLGRTVYRFRITGGLSVRDAIAALQSRGATISAQPSYSYDLAQTANRPANRPATQGDSAQYIVPKLSLVEAHNTSTGRNVKIAVIDSGIDRQHPDLNGVITGEFDALPSSDLRPHPHGTGMAGAIGSHQRLLGVAPGAHILGIRAFGVADNGAQGTSMNIVKGLEWAVSQGAQIINMSFAGPRDPILEQAIKTIREKGIILIAAAGNAGPKSPPLFPAADPNVIAVSATDADDKTYTGAVRGRHVAIAAPGVDILVPAPEGGYQLTTGTSVAAAHISGVVALLLERNPRLTPAEVKSILAATAKKLPQSRTDVGAGLVDPVQALAKSGPRQAQAR